MPSPVIARFELGTGATFTSTTLQNTEIVTVVMTPDPATIPCPVPATATSAGITMMTAIASALTEKRVRPFVAMTGEITLRGQVLPVGGIKEKVLAAKRAGIKEIIMCWQNEKDVEEIDASFIKGLKFHYVKTMQQVLELALVP